MIEYLIDKLACWKEQIKDKGIWDAGDCEAYSRIVYAVKHFYGGDKE